MNLKVRKSLILRLGTLRFMGRTVGGRHGTDSRKGCQAGRCRFSVQPSLATGGPKTFVAGVARALRFFTQTHMKTIVKTQNSRQTTQLQTHPARQTPPMDTRMTIRSLLLLGIYMILTSTVLVGAQPVETLTMDYKYVDLGETKVDVTPGKITAVGYIDTAQINEWMRQVRATNGLETVGQTVTGRGKDGITGETFTIKAVQLNYRQADGSVNFFRWTEHSRAYGAKLSETASVHSDTSGYEGEVSFRGGTGRYSGATGSGIVSSTLEGVLGTITLLRPPAPLLGIRRSPDGITISWDKSVTSYILIGSPELSGAAWTALPGVLDNAVTVQGVAARRFYRLAW